MSRTQQVRKPGSGALSRGTFLYLAAGTVAILAYFLLPEIPQNVLYILVGISAVAATLVGARRQAVDRRLPLYLLAGGLAMAVADEIIYTVYEDVLLVEDPFPSVADVFFVANYPFYAAALVLLVRCRTPGR